MNILQALDRKPEPGELVLCVPSGWETYISLEFHEIHQGLVASGERYASLLSNHPAMLVCGSIFGYLVAKVFEAMAAGCLVIAERSSLGERLSALGFIEGEHYVGTDLLHVIEDATRVRDGFLQGNPAGRCIASNAMHKVAAEHTTAIRATQIHHICSKGRTS